VIVNQQVPGSLPNEAFIEGVNRLAEEFGEKIILLDSRHYGGKFRKMIRRTNAREAARLLGFDPGRVDVVGIEVV